MMEEGFLGKQRQEQMNVLSWVSSRTRATVKAGLLFLTLWPSGPAAATARPFTIGSLGDLSDVLPLKQYAGDANGINMLVNPPILYLQSSGRVSCVLCKEIPEHSIRRDGDKGPSQMLISLVLKKKLVWGDGQPLTREDVKFTLEFMARRDYPKGQHPILPIKRIEFSRDQDNMLSLVLQHRRSDAPQLFAIRLLPKHKEEQLKKLLSLRPEDKEYQSLIRDPGFYYGSYRVAEAGPQFLRLDPNKENEWEGSPSQKLEVRFFPKLSALTQALEKGEIDQTFSGQLHWDQYLELLEASPNLAQRYDAQFSPSETLELMLLNMRSPLLINPSMRQAVFHAIDREAINKASYQGGGATSEGVFKTEQSRRSGEKLPAAYRVDLSEQLLEQANWKKREDGWRYNEKGERLTLTLSCTEERLKSGWTKLVASDLQKVGIEMKVELGPEAEYFRQTLGHLRFKDAACMRWKIPPLTPPIHLFHGLAIPNSENGYIGLNFSGWEQTAVNRLLESMMREPEIGHLVRLYTRLERHFLSDVPAVPLVYIPEVTLTRKAEPNSGIPELQKALAAYPAGSPRSGRTQF